MTDTLASNATTAPYDRRDWQQGYASQPQEFDYPIEAIDGTLPPDLNGTLFRNGPGLLDVNGQPLHHPFDGDGMVCAVTFRHGRARFRNRFVRTPGFIEEQQAGGIRYRGVFGTQKPGGWLANALDLRLKNVANTNIIYWGGRLLALWEAGEPYRLDPATLETLGPDTLDGILPPGGAFAAHPRIDPSSPLNGGAPSLVNFALQPGLSTKVTVYELDPAGQLLQRQAFSLPGFAFIHDFALTPHYCLFFQNPLAFNPLPYLLGWRTQAQCLRFQPGRPTCIAAVPRDPSAGEPVRFWEAPAGFIFHHANAFEREGGLTVDSIGYADFPELDPEADFRQVDFAALPPGQLWRTQLEWQRERATCECLEPQCCEFPAPNPNCEGRPYRYLFLAAAHQARGNAPLQALLKRDGATGEREVWSAAPRGFVGEPAFVPKANASAEDDGWVLMWVYQADAHRTDVVVLDGRAIVQGPVARLRLRHHVPYGLHGSWTPQCFVAP